MLRPVSRTANRGGDSVPLRFNVNISMLFTELPVRERLRRVRETGLSAIEFLFARQFDVAELERGVRDFGLEVALFDLDVEPGTLGYLGLPNGEAEVERTLAEALALARRLGCHRLNALVGHRLPGLEPARQRALAAERLRRAVPRAEAAGVVLLVEALNPVDRPAYLVHTSAEAMEIVDAVASPWVRFQYDVYHMQIAEGDLIRTFRRLAPSIGHVQIADPPDRHEPGTGEINYPNVLRAIAATGYDGWIGLEYVPSQPDPLAWLSALPSDLRG